MDVCNPPPAVLQPLVFRPGSPSPSSAPTPTTTPSPAASSSWIQRQKHHSQQKASTSAVWLQRNQPFRALLVDEIWLPGWGCSIFSPAPAPRDGGDEHPKKWWQEVVTQHSPHGPQPAPAPSPRGHGGGLITLGSQG